MGWNQCDELDEISGAGERCSTTSAASRFLRTTGAAGFAPPSATWKA